MKIQTDDDMIVALNRLLELDEQMEKLKAEYQLIRDALVEYDVGLVE